MKLQMSDSAAQWYVDELELQENDHVRFFVRYGGIGGHQPGFSLGVANEKPENPAAETNMDGVLFFIENEDLWYFDGADLFVQLEKEQEEPEFLYK
ncbi:HesB/YadR/YfhF family protein [Virgibacillus senegalensis]|uniref:HesB/YadR/YfhF family protein n=1 Tax=Virgibacillus senegalensis TaxID=1499679 RepID=UPI00069EF2C8|nr:HesB/YadR/YfhF family protein [Virgibacillus senegalensis]